MSKERANMSNSNNEEVLELSKNNMDAAIELIQLVVKAKILEKYKYTDATKVPNITLYLQDISDGNYERLWAILTDPQFKENLCLELASNGVLIDIDTLCFFKQMPSSGNAELLADGVYLLIEDQEHTYTGQSKIVKKAKITVLQGNMQKKFYVLDSSKMIKYDIGRGENPRLSNNMFHHNHIVFTDEDNNKNVSRKHACISFSSSRGFCLQAYDGGSPSSGNRTRILREKEKIDLITPMVDYALEDGDQIELGKKNILRFEII